mgnify:FL=1
MDSLNEFKKYIEMQINNIAENGKLIEQSQNLVNKLENLYVLLATGNYSNIDLNNFKDCLNFIFEGEDVNLIIEKINQSITIVNDNIFAAAPQRPVAEEHLNKINALVLKNIEKLKENIMKIKAEVDDKVFDYREYSDLIKDGQIVRHLSDKDLKKFFDFLKQSSLDQNVVLDLTVLFCKDSIDYAENLRKLRIAKEEAVKKDNVAKVKEQIKKQNKVEIEETNVEVSEVRLTLTPEENEIYYRILEIMNILTNNIELNHDTLVDLLNDDFSLEDRKSIYDSTEDKFNLVLEDLKVNLIPNFENNKDDVMTIFRYIIVLFNEEYKKEEEIEFVSQIADFSEEEKKEIEKYLEVVNREFEYYSGLDKKDKDMIDSIRTLIAEDSENKIEISPKFSLDYVKYFDLIRRFHSVYSEYLEYRNTEREYIVLGEEEAINSYLVSQMTEIRDILGRLSKQYELLNGKEDNNDKTNDTSVVSQYIPDRKTLFVFLPLSDGNYSIVDDQQEIFKTLKKAMSSVAKGLYAPSVTGFDLYISSQGEKSVTVTPDRDIPGYRDEIDPHRYKHGAARITYVRISVSASNQEKIKEAYGVEKADVLLIIECSTKMNDSSKGTYNDVNRRIAKEIGNIRYVFNLFSTDFDDASFKAATGLIDDSEKYCERLYKDPFKKLDDESLWR